MGPGFSVGSIIAEGIPDIYDAKEACFEGDFIAFDTEGVSGAIPSFVVIDGDIEGGAKVFDGIKHFVRVHGVLHHDASFFGCEGAWFS